MKKLIKLIPAKVRVKKDVSYEIVFIESFDNDENCLGMCRHESKQILIKLGQSPTETFKTFIHELLHAISFEYPKLNLTENQVLILEDAIFRLLRLNKVIDLLLKII
jgi:hypothetical protein